MVTNFDNVIVASKAWCMLFAICDWVDSIELDKKRRQEQEGQESVSLRSVLKNASNQNENWQTMKSILLNGNPILLICLTLLPKTRNCSMLVSVTLIIGKREITENLLVI